MFSLRKRFASLEQTVDRFPIVFVALLGLTAMVVILIWSSHFGIEQYIEHQASKILLVGLLFVFGSATITKHRSANKTWELIGQGVLLLAAIGYFFLLPSIIDDMHMTTVIRHGVLQVGVILALLIVPLWTQKRSGTSMYNGVIQLLLHAALAFIFSLVLAGGIAGALAGIEALFEVDITSEWYPTVFAVVGILFGGLSFLDGVRQRHLDDTSSVETAKRKTLLGWVIGLLLALYGVILYAYLGKILLTGEWPSNQVTGLGFAFSAFVLVASILLVPLVTDPKKALTRQRLISTMYLLLVPVLVMIFMAIMMRVEQYGLTEMRYLVYAILLGLLLSTIYMVFSKQKDTRRVGLIFLALIVVSALGGPISASGVALDCQQTRLDAFVESHKVLTDGMLDKEKIAALSDEDQRDLAALIDYLVEYHGSDAIADYYETDQDNGYSVLSVLGLPTSYRWEGIDGPTRQYLNVGREMSKEPARIDEYSLYIPGISLYAGNEQQQAKVAGITTQLAGGNLILGLSGSQLTVDLGTILTANNNQTVGFKRFANEGVGLLIDYLHGYKENGVVTVEGVQFDLFVE